MPIDGLRIGLEKLFPSKLVLKAEQTLTSGVSKCHLIAYDEMANKYYQTGEGRAPKVRDLFAAVAPRYDLINDLQSLGLHRVWKKTLVTMTGACQGEKALDVCCGTGDLARNLANQGAEVTGLDFSDAMLAVARAKDSAGRVTWLQGDALNLPFQDETFHIVTIGYGLRNLRDFSLALTEFFRVLRAGGRMAILDFGKPDNAVWRSVYLGYLRWFVPLFGKLFCGDAQTHSYIVESLKHYPAQRGIAELISKLGGQDVRTVNLLGGAMSITVARKPTA